MAVADRIATRGRDYGTFLVLLAFGLRIGLAVGVTVWGIGVRRATRAGR
ncbi:hypothetical protein [Nocardia wallacei]|nr:hypothetical protein [Nocardia wallacei]